jgi:hypothetical protein
LKLVSLDSEYLAILFLFILVGLVFVPTDFLKSLPNSSSIQEGLRCSFLNYLRCFAFIKITRWFALEWNWLSILVVLVMASIVIPIILKKIRKGLFFVFCFNHNLTRDSRLN